MTKFITKTYRYTVDNNSSAKVGGKTATYNKETEKNGSQAGGRGGGGKLQKFRVPIDEQSCDGVQPEKGGERDVTRAYVQLH